MPDAPFDPDAWMDELPLDFAAQVVVPDRFESHVDRMAHARKVIGRDPEGARCYLMHVHTEVEERFDIDEFPLEVTVGRERRVAWRLRDGRWLMQVDRLHRLDSCRPKLEHRPPCLVTEHQLGF